MPVGDGRIPVVMTTPKPPPGHFTLLYFAAATSFTQGRHHDFLPAPTSIPRLFATIEEKYPGIRAQVLDSAALTVNLEYVDLDEEMARSDTDEDGLVIKEGDEVGIIPPVSSG